MSDTVNKTEMQNMMHDLLQTIASQTQAQNVMMGQNNNAAATGKMIDLTTVQKDAATLVTEADGIGSNDNDTTIPTSSTTTLGIHKITTFTAGSNTVSWS